MSLLTFLALGVTLTSVKCSIHLSEDSQNILNNLACQTAAENEARVTYVYSEDLYDELPRCLSTANVPIFTTTFDSLKVTGDYSSMHILTISSDTQKRLQQIGATLSSTGRKKHLSKYVLIFKVPCEKFLKFIFTQFWKKGFLNAIALCPTPQQIYTYEPFTESGFNIVKLTPPMQLFYDKLKNLHHYQIRASQFYDPIRSIPTANSSEFRGIDGFLGKAIVHHLNGTMQIFSPPNGELYGSEVDGVLSGGLKQVVTGAVNVSWNLRFIDEKQRRLVEPLYPIGKPFMLYLIVPKASTVPQYTNFIRVFNTVTWWILLLHFIIATVVFTVIQQMALRLAKRNGRAQHFGNVVATFLKTALGVPVDGFHRNSSLRAFLIGWILFCYVTRTIYLAKMESVFIHPKYEEDLNSLVDLWRLKVPIYSHDSYIKTIEPSLDPVLFKAIVSRHRSLPENYDALMRSMAKSSNEHAFILRRERAKAMIARTLDKEANRPMYHIVKEYLVSLPQAYIVTQGSVFYEKFDSLVIRCYEHGLMKYWEAVSKADVIQNPGEEFTDYAEKDDDDSGESAKGAIVLNMAILQGAFYLWIIGMGSACWGFLMELCYFKWKGT